MPRTHDLAVSRGRDHLGCVSDLTKESPRGRHLRGERNDWRADGKNPSRGGAKEIDLGEATVSPRRMLALLLTAVTLVGGSLWAVEDAFLLAGLVCAAGLIWSSRQWKAWPLAALLLMPGLWLSRADARRCSAWWRGRVLYAKLAGGYPSVDLFRQVYPNCAPSPCCANK